MTGTAFRRSTRAVRTALAVAAAIAAGIAAGGAAAVAADSAVILQYHRFGEDAYPTTSVTIDQFEAHIEHLAGGGYAVLPVPEILAALDEGRPLPERAVGITVDDATRSTFEEAWPRLEKAGFPFTVFVSTDPVDEGHASIMGWDELRRLVAAGATIGNHGAAHGHMGRGDETGNRADLRRARRRIETELGVDATRFAYPYGEWNGALRALVAEFGFTAAFGQHSGVLAAHTDRLNLPRFALNERYGGIDRFRLIVDTLPLGVRAVTPVDQIMGGEPADGRPHDRSRRRRGPMPLPVLHRAASRSRSTTRARAASRCASTGPSLPGAPGLNRHRSSRGRTLALVRPPARRAPNALTRPPSPAPRDRAGSGGDPAARPAASIRWAARPAGQPPPSTGGSSTGPRRSRPAGSDE